MSDQVLAANLATDTQPPVLRIRERLSWTLADHAAASLTNALVSFGAANSLSPHEFGGFALAFTLAMVATGVARAISSEPLAVAYSGADDRRWPDAVNASLSAASSAAVIASTLCLSALVFVPNELRGTVLALAVVLPGLLLHDVLRMALFAGGWPSYAFRLDVTWGAVIVLPTLYLALVDGSTAAHWLAVWGMGATVVAIGWLLILRPQLSLTRAIAWWIAHRSLAGPFAVEFLVRSGTIQVTAIAVGAIAGLAEVGAVRGSGMLLAPLQILLAGVVNTAVPHAVMSRRHDPVALDRFVIGLAGGLAIVMSLGAVTLALPDVLGERLLGATWDKAQPLLLPVTVSMVLTGVATAAIVGLRVLHEARASLRIRLLSAPAIIASGCLGAALDGAHGAAVGLAIAQAVVTPLWWRTYRRCQQAHLSPRSAAS